jgi:light-regulated signal transduction histidine kinase (bacteriophytochrome)
MEKTTEQLQNELLQSRNQVARLEKELEEFAYVASHDLQEPLRKISTFIQRLEHKLEGSADADTNMYIERIQASAGNMRNLIESLLDYSRAGRSSAPKEVIRLDRLIAEVQTELEPLIKETDAQIDISSLPVVEGIPNLLSQLFYHLLKNALVFRKPDQKPVISIREFALTTTVLEEQGLDVAEKYCGLVVEDNGIGFDNSYAERIFELFQRLHGKYEYPGAGMGLAISRKIVNSHGGRLYARSEGDRGSCFYLILPKPH